MKNELQTINRVITFVNSTAGIMKELTGKVEYKTLARITRNQLKDCCPAELIEIGLFRAVATNWNCEV